MVEAESAGSGKTFRAINTKVRTENRKSIHRTLENSQNKESQYRRLIRTGEREEQSDNSQEMARTH